MKILFLQKAPDATAHYRCSIPAKNLKNSGHEIRMSFIDAIPGMRIKGVQEADVEWADVLVCQRPLTEFAHNVIKQIKERKPDKVLVGDYDDDYYSVPRWNPGFDYVTQQGKWFPKIPELYDGVITSTEPLAEVFRSKVSCPVRVIKNGFDFMELDRTPPFNQEVIMHAPTKDKKNGWASKYAVTREQFNGLMQDRIVMAWAGSRYHYVDLDWIVDEMRDLCKQNDDIVFLFVGYLQGKLVDCVPTNRMFICQGRSPISAFYSMLKSIKIDGYLAPLDPCEFNRSKSALKFLEAGALGFYPILSAWDAYEDELDPEVSNDDEKYGLLAGYEKGDWVKAMLQARELLIDKDRAKHMRLANDAYVRNNHDAPLRTTEYELFFNELLERKRLRNEVQSDNPDDPRNGVSG